MSNPKYVYFCEMFRFGHTMQAIGFSEAEVREAMIKEYVETYKKYNNGCDPRDEDECDSYGDNYYDMFIEELFIDKREIGVVSWE